MKGQKELKGFAVKPSPMASSEELVTLLLKKDYAAAERILKRERKRSELAAERYVASLVAQAR